MRRILFLLIIGIISIATIGFSQSGQAPSKWKFIGPDSLQNKELVNVIRYISHTTGDTIFFFEGKFYKGVLNEEDSVLITRGELASGAINVLNLVVDGDLEVRGVIEVWNRETNFDLSQARIKKLPDGTNAQELFVPNMIRDSLAITHTHIDSMADNLHPSIIYIPQGIIMPTPTFWRNDSFWIYPDMPVQQSHWDSTAIDRDDTIIVRRFLVTTPIPASREGGEAVDLENPHFYVAFEDTNANNTNSWISQYSFTDTVYWIGDSVRLDDPGTEDSITFTLPQPVWDIDDFPGSVHLSDPSLMSDVAGDIWMLFRVTYPFLDTLFDTLSQDPDVVEKHVLSNDRIVVTKKVSDFLWSTPVVILDTVGHGFDDYLSPDWWLDTDGTYKMILVQRVDQIYDLRSDSTLAVGHNKLPNIIQMFQSTTTPDGTWTSIGRDTIIDTISYNDGGDLATFTHHIDTFGHVAYRPTWDGADTLFTFDTLLEAWHLGMTRLNSDELLMFLVEDTRGPNNVNTRMALSKSRDGGHTWTDQRVIIFPGIVNSFDRNLVYRGDGHRMLEGDEIVIRLYYSGGDAQFDVAHPWGMGMTKIYFSDSLPGDTTDLVASKDFVRDSAANVSHSHVDTAMFILAALGVTGSDSAISTNILYGDGFDEDDFVTFIAKDSLITGANINTEFIITFPPIPDSTLIIDSVWIGYKFSSAVLADIKIDTIYMYGPKVDSMIADSIFDTIVTEMGGTLTYATQKHPLGPAAQTNEGWSGSDPITLRFVLTGDDTEVVWIQNVWIIGRYLKSIDE